MNLKQALYVKTIAEEGGITAAAKKLYVSQPSLSQMLRQIEEELGLTLFDRSHIPFRLTYAGERYLHAANVMLNADEILRNELQGIRQENSGRIRLGISMQRAADLLPEVLPAFFERYPQVTLELREAGSAKLIGMVQEGEVDLALAATHAGDPGLEYRLIQTETIGILAGKDSALAARAASGSMVRLEEIKEGPFIELKVGHNLRVIQDYLFQQESLRPVILLETDNLETALRVTRAGWYYMLCMDSYTLPQDYFYPLEGYDNHRHYYACFRRSQSIPKYMLELIALVQDVCAKKHKPV